MDLLSGGLDQLLDLGGGGPPPAQAPNPIQTQMNQNPMGGGLLDLMGGGPPAPQAAATTGLDALGNMGLFGSAAPPTVNSNKVKDLRYSSGIDFLKGSSDQSNFIFLNRCRKETDPTYNESEIE